MCSAACDERRHRGRSPPHLRSCLAERTALASGQPHGPWHPHRQACRPARGPASRGRRPLPSGPDVPTLHLRLPASIRSPQQPDTTAVGATPGCARRCYADRPDRLVRAAGCAGATLSCAGAELAGRGPGRADAPAHGDDPAHDQSSRRALPPHSARTSSSPSPYPYSYSYSSGRWLLRLDDGETPVRDVSRGAPQDAVVQRTGNPKE